MGWDFFGLDWKKYAHRLVYSGRLDAFFDYCYGELEYRTLRFDSKTLTGDYQGVTQINYTDERTPFMRVTEHKHFHNRNQKKTVVEPLGVPGGMVEECDTVLPRSATPGTDAACANATRNLADMQPEIVIGGRLGNHRYYDMHQVIGAALKTAQQCLR